MNRFLLITSPLLLSVFSVVLFGESSAYASSPYDNVFSVVDNVSINHMQGAGTSRDYSLDWSSEAVAAAQAKCDRIGGQSCQDAIDLNNLVGSTDQDDNDWAVFADPSHNFYTIVYTTTPHTGTTSWIQSNGDYFLEFNSTSYNSIRSINIYYWPEGYDHSDNGSYALPSSAFGISVNGGYPVFISTFPITYPTGYEGDIIPETYDPPVVNDSTPDFFVVSSVNGLITVRDRRFNTFDNVPFLCEDGLTPYIRYTLQDLDHYLIFDTGGFSPTVDYQFQLPVKNEIINYEFSGRYDCGENTDPSFPNSSSVQFQLDPLGGLKTDLFEECISQEFPFIHYQGCYENVMRMLNMLSFSSLKINGWTYNAQCRQLTVLGGWLGTQPGEVICPNFSPQVRNTVTPFIAFFLGLTMFGFVVRMRGNT